MRLPGFMITGGMAGLLQICVLALLRGHGWPPVIGAAVAALAGAQLNFALSSWFTWRDRPATALWRRWLLYHASIAGTMVLNVFIFSLLRSWCPEALASAGGIVIAGIGNYFLGEHLVFRARHPKAGMGWPVRKHRVAA